MLPSAGTHCTTPIILTDILDLSMNKIPSDRKFLTLRSESKNTNSHHKLNFPLSQYYLLSTVSDNYTVCKIKIMY